MALKQDFCHISFDLLSIEVQLFIYITLSYSQVCLPNFYVVLWHAYQLMFQTVLVKKSFCKLFFTAQIVWLDKTYELI